MKLFHEAIGQSIFLMTFCQHVDKCNCQTWFLSLFATSTQFWFAAHFGRTCFSIFSVFVFCKQHIAHFVICFANGVMHPEYRTAMRIVNCAKNNNCKMHLFSIEDSSANAFFIEPSHCDNIFMIGWLSVGFWDLCRHAVNLKAHSYAMHLSHIFHHFAESLSVRGGYSLFLYFSRRVYASYCHIVTPKWHRFHEKIKVVIFQLKKKKEMRIKCITIRTVW